MNTGSNLAGALTRRAVVGAAVAAVAAPRRAFAASSDTPILFVHDAGDSAATWLTQLWRFESNGFARERLFAIDLPDPIPRDDDAVAQSGRSSSGEQRDALAQALKTILQTSGAGQVAIVAHGRGGLTARNLLQDQASALTVSRLILCGAPNRGLFDSEQLLGSEFNARGAFMRRLNAGPAPAPAGVATLSLLSDGYDRFAQREAIVAGKGGFVGPGPEGPALGGALNVVIGPRDHRELATSPRAFREMARFLLGRDPLRIAVGPEAEPQLEGVVTGLPKGLPTNRPLADATVEVYRVEPETGARVGGPLLQKITTADGRWGPVAVKPDWPLEFVVTAPGHPATHIYRSPFPRSTSILNLRPARPFDKADQGKAAVVLMMRPRGYFGLPRDVVSLDGREPDDVTRGLPHDWVTTLRVSAQDMEKPIVGLFNQERIVARAWPASEARMTVLEMTN